MTDTKAENKSPDPRIPELDAILSDITNQKNKLEQLTKKMSTMPSKNSVNTNTNAPVKHDKPSKKTQKAEITEVDLQGIPSETANRVLELLKNYVKMDKSYRLKHESLKTLYNAYLDLYKKYKSTKSQSGNNTVSVNSPTPTTEEPLKHEEMLKNIHTEMKENNSNLYRERLLVLKKIKEHPEIDQQAKNQLCGRLIAIFKSPPIPEYKPLALLGSQVVGGTNDNQEYGEEKISVSELDDAYLQKHNELMTVYKAYQNLYNKVLNYKEQLDKYKKLPTGSSISRCQMEKMIKDQRFVMDMIDKMQDKLVRDNVLPPSEKVVVAPVASHPENMGAFNDTVRNQIRHIIDRNVDIHPGTKNKIEELLGQYQQCDSNDKFCQAGREILLLKKL